METTNQPQSQADLDLLLAEVRPSPFIGQLTQQEIQTRIKDETIRFFYQDSELIGFGAWDNIDERWREIGMQQHTTDLHARVAHQRIAQIPVFPARRRIHDQHFQNLLTDRDRKCL